MAPLNEVLSNAKPASRASVSPIVQIHLHLAADLDRQLVDYRKLVLDWLATRADRALPPQAAAGQSFEISEPGAKPVAVVALDFPAIWAARFDDIREDGRTWVTEMALAQQADSLLLFALRLQCVSRGADLFNPRYSIPSVVRDVIQLGGATLDDRPLDLEPWLVSTAQEVNELVRLLRHPHRAVEVIVISLPDNSDSASDAAIEPSRLCRALAGAAHVVVITGPATFMLSDRLGKAYSVY